MDEKGIEIIDLSQDIFPGMPVFPGLPDVNISIHVSHEQWDTCMLIVTLFHRP